MNFRNFQLQGFLETEADIKKIEKLILDTYKEAGVLIDNRLKKLFLEMDGIAPEDRYNWLIKFDRNLKLKKDIADIYTDLDLKAKGYTQQASEIGFYNSYYRSQFELEWVLPITFSTVNKNLAVYAVTGQLEAWKKLSEEAKKRYKNPALWSPSGTLTDLFAKNRKDAILSIQRTINSGMMVGDSYAKISKKVADIIGKETKGKATGIAAKALRIVRTEGGRALSMGQYANVLDTAAKGYDITRMWDATQDLRTRPAHGSADGQEVGVDEPFIVGGESLMNPRDPAGSAGNIINCRCVAITLPMGIKPTKKTGKDPVKEANWDKATSAERKAGELKDGTKLYSPSQQYEEFDYRVFNDYVNIHELKKNKYGQIY